MKELGDYLKETRESNCIGLEEASEDLSVSINVLENIENGNTRAFRDMYDLKEKVKDYSKYLGLDPEKIIDEFNDFFFEHTSKIKLSDILEAEEEQKTKQLTITSPYTKIKEKKVDDKYLKIAALFVGCLVLLVIIVFVILLMLIPKENITNRELSSKVMEVNNEYS